jgi:hypothetical protein
MRLDRNTRIFARRTNVERYRRMLETPLTVAERLFVERRLAEEEAAVRQIACDDTPMDASTQPA